MCFMNKIAKICKTDILLFGSSDNILKFDIENHEKTFLKNLKKTIQWVKSIDCKIKFILQMYSARTSKFQQKNFELRGKTPLRGLPITKKAKKSK